MPVQVLLSFLPCPAQRSTFQLVKIIMITQGHPRPQPRPRVIRGRAISTLDPLASSWKARIRASSSAIPRELGSLAPGPLSCSMAFLMPTKDAARFGKPHTQVPDLDNLAKLVLDAIQDTGLIANDSHVALLSVSKSWAPADKAGVIVELENLEAQPGPLGSAKPDWLK
jgi:Holliday junction resolvase RusA-like endonuclease